MKCNSEVNLSKKRYCIKGNEEGYINAVNESRIYQACLNVLLNFAEFSAKILQDLCPCNEIKFELLAKVTITCATHYNTHACAHFGFFQKASVEMSIL